MESGGVRYDFDFIMTYSVDWIMFPNVSLFSTIFLCKVFGSRERVQPPLIHGDSVYKIQYIRVASSNSICKTK